jgi:hypothetical protein
MSTEFFQFEADFISTLRCIPMIVRYKLDTCGIKLKLTHWHQISLSERDTLVALPCFTPGEIQNYQNYLKELVFKYTGTYPSLLPMDPHPPWLDSTTLPKQLIEKLETLGARIALEQWQDLTPLQRFVLVKLSLPNHENKNFPRAMAEFDLYPHTSSLITNE